MSSNDKEHAQTTEPSESPGRSGDIPTGTVDVIALLQEGCSYCFNANQEHWDNWLVKFIEHLRSSEDMARDTGANIYRNWLRHPSLNLMDNFHVILTNKLLKFHGDLSETWQVIVTEYASNIDTETEIIAQIRERAQAAHLEVQRRNAASESKGGDEVLTDNEETDVTNQHAPTQDGDTPSGGLGKHGVPNIKKNLIHPLVIHFHHYLLLPWVTLCNMCVAA